MTGARSGSPPENHKAIVFHTGPDTLKNHKDSKPAFNVVGPSSVSRRNAIEMAFRWQADDGTLPMAFCWRSDDGPLLVVHVFGSSLPS